jgi:ABC-2 type transport system permease protein
MSAFRSVAFGVAWRNLHNFFSNPALLLPALVFPLFFFTAFAGGLSRVDDVPGFAFGPGYTAWTYMFVLLQASAFGGVFTGFAIARDFEGGFARRLMLASPDRRGVLAGYVLAGLARAVFVVALVTLIAVVVGLRVDGSPLELAGVYALALLVNLTAVLFAAGIAMRLRTMQAGPAMQMPTFLILFLAPVWVPYDLLAGWVHAVASVNPITAVLDAGRGFIAGEPVKAALAYLLLAGLVALAGTWALRGLRSAERAA